MSLALFGPEGICLHLQILQPIQSHILSIPTFSTSDVMISHLHGSSTVPQEAKGVKTLLHDEIRKTRQLLLISDENLPK